jgi:hypothetical protein
MVEYRQGKTHEHGKPWWNIDRGRLLIRPPQLSNNPTRRVSFTSSPKEGVLRIVIAIKYPSPYTDFEPASLGSSGKHIIITPSEDDLERNGWFASNSGQGCELSQIPRKQICIRRIWPGLGSHSIFHASYVLLAGHLM